MLCYGVPEKEEVTIDFSPQAAQWRVVYQQMPRSGEEGAAHAQVGGVDALRGAEHQGFHFRLFHL